MLRRHLHLGDPIRVIDIVAAVALTAIFGAGCSGSVSVNSRPAEVAETETADTGRQQLKQDQKEQKEKIAAIEAEEEAVKLNQALFLERVKLVEPSLSELPDEQLLDWGQASCSALDGAEYGDDTYLDEWSELISAWMFPKGDEVEGGLTGSEASAIVNTAAVAFCPEHVETVSHVTSMFK